jgi:membrane protein DedA with SNARE-associated domain
MRLLPTGLAVLLLLIVWRSRRRVPRTLLLAGVVVSAALAVYGSGVVDPPDFEELLLDIGDAFGRWAYVLVGGLAFLETGAFVGLIAPGETAVIAGGVFAGQENLDLFVLLPLVWACCIGGDCVSYWLGRKLGRGFLVKHGPRVQITEERLVTVELFFERRGGITILIGRFIGIIRALAPFVAGASKMPFAKFFPYDVVGCGLWASTFVLLGYFSWRNIDRAAEIASRGTLAVGTLATITIVSYLAFKYLRTAEQRAAARLWLRDRRGRDVAPRRHNMDRS